MSEHTFKSIGVYMSTLKPILLMTIWRSSSLYTAYVQNNYDKKLAEAYQKYC